MVFEVIDMEIIDVINRKEISKKYYQKNKEKIKKFSKEYYNKNKEKHNDYTKKYYQENKEQCKKYYQENKEQCSNNAKKRNRQLRIKVLEKYGFKCANPFNINHGDFLSEIRCLQIDHINGGGAKERKEITNLFYKKVLDDKEGNYQLLCANCNWIKRHINNENRR